MTLLVPCPRHYQMPLTFLNSISPCNFTGKVTIDFGGMPNLWGLFLASNPLGKGNADDLSFLNSLTKCRSLKVLDLSGSQFGGELPSAIANLSTQLMTLKMDNNHLTGRIPPGIGILVNMTDLILSKNGFTGSIPVLIGNLQIYVELICLKISYQVRFHPL